MINKRTGIIIGIILIALVGLMYLFGGNGKRYSWWENYRTDSENPYGTSIVYALLQDYFPGQTMEVVEDSLANILQKEETSGSYFYLGSSLWMDSLRTNAMLGFVARGNDAFIITPNIPTGILDSIGSEDCGYLVNETDSVYYSIYDHFIYDTLSVLNFSHPDLTDENGYRFIYRYQDKEEYYRWSFLPRNLFCEYQDKFIPLGTISDSLINFSAVKYGDGHFYFHTTPLVFTNFNIVKEGGREYAEKVFSHLDQGPILWDKTKRSFEFPGQNRGFSRSPLVYILSQPALAWGWYLLLGMAVLYLVFRAKRQQRIIPVLEKNENTSLAFINTIGRLYFIQGNHRQLALQKMKLFLGFVRDRYHLPTNKLDEQFQKQLSAKSEIPLSVIQKILTIHENIESSKFTSENTLMAFHREMEGFYLRCK